MTEPPERVITGGPAAVDYRAAAWAAPVSSTWSAAQVDMASGLALAQVERDHLEGVPPDQRSGASEGNGSVWHDWPGLEDISADHVSARPDSMAPTAGESGAVNGIPWHSRARKPVVQSNGAAGALEIIGGLTIAGAVLYVIAALAESGSSSDNVLAVVAGLAIGMQGLLVFAFGWLVRS